MRLAVHEILRAPSFSGNHWFLYKKSVCASRNFLQSGKSFFHCRAMMSRSWAFVQEVPKDFQNLKMLMNFGWNTRFIFFYNLAKNDHIWVFWPEGIIFFRFCKCIFSMSFLYTNKTARRSQLRDIISRQWEKLFQFCSWKHVFQIFRINQIKAK